MKEFMKIVQLPLGYSGEVVVRTDRKKLEVRGTVKKSSQQKHLRVGESVNRVSFGEGTRIELIEV